jgi:hypothetical protein
VSYATADQLRAVAVTMSDDLTSDYINEQLDAILERASQDLDGWLCWPIPDPDSAVVPPCRIDLSTLSAWEVWVLQTACVQQALYRLGRDEVDLLEGPPDLLSAGGVSFAAQAPPLVGPMALLALAGATNLQRYRTGCAAPPVPEPLGNGA